MWHSVEARRGKKFLLKATLCALRERESGSPLPFILFCIRKRSSIIKFIYAAALPSSSSLSLSHNDIEFFISAQYLSIYAAWCGVYFSFSRYSLVVPTDTVPRRRFVAIDLLWKSSELCYFVLRTARGFERIHLRNWLSLEKCRIRFLEVLWSHIHFKKFYFFFKVFLRTFWIYQKSGKNPFHEAHFKLFPTNNSHRSFLAFLLLRSASN